MKSQHLGMENVLRKLKIAKMVMPMLSEEDIMKKIVYHVEQSRKTEFGTVIKLGGSPLLIRLSSKRDISEIVEIIRNSFDVVGITTKVNDDVSVMYLTDLRTACPFELEIFSDMIVIHLHAIRGFENWRYVKTVNRFIDNVRKFIDKNIELEIESEGRVST